MYKFLTLFLFSFIVFNAEQGTSQKNGKPLKIVSLGFYNLENLFDTVDDTLINDEEFLPQGARAWTDERYQEKLANMAYVISQIGIFSGSI